LYTCTKKVVFIDFAPYDFVTKINIFGAPPFF